MKSVNLLFPHQLFQRHEILDNQLPILLVEEYLFFRQFNFHKIKLIFHRASMKCYEAFLKDYGATIDYVEAHSELSDVRKLIAQLAQDGIKTIHYVDPTDNWLEKRIEETAKKFNLNTIQYKNPSFINSKNDLSGFFKKSKTSFFQTTFYKQQRLKHHVLIEDDGSPTGGKWSFDAENRKKYPKTKLPPAVQFPMDSMWWTEAVNYVEKQFSSNLGSPDVTVVYPHNLQQTNAWLEQFLTYRFFEFGDYEDAIVSGEMVLHHSVLTPMLNVGLLKPNELLNQVLAYEKTCNIPLNALEGFIRQVMGWREFIRGIYECKGSEARTKNYWGFKRKIPTSFYDGSTGIEPVDQTIKKVLKTGYCHHIERLMILGNFMLLCEFDPDAVYQWFMEMFIDAYDWVMVPNVYGMSQFADGGIFATKPYISGSNYIVKMSNFKKDGWCEIWDGLFWRFMHVNRHFFLKNPRLAMLVGTFDKMPIEKQQLLVNRADEYLASLDEALVG